MSELFLTKRGLPVSSKNNLSENSNRNFTAPLSEIESLMRESIDDGGQFSVVTAGTSMMPLLRNRKDTVILVKPLGRLSRYDIPLYKRDNGQYVLHRVVKVCDSEYHLCGDNQLTIEKGITDCRVIAVVSKIIRNGKVIDISKSCAYKLYVFVWCRCFFIRFCLLKYKGLCSRIKIFFTNLNKK